MVPRPVAPNERLPEPLEACRLLCTVCCSGLLYQRQERPRFPRHFFWCRRCGRRYAARTRMNLALASGDRLASFVVVDMAKVRRMV